MSPRWFSRRAAAYLLIALVVCPFSAPLSVCDLSDLGPKTTVLRTAPLSNSPLRASVVKDALAQAFPIRASRRTPDAASLRGPSVVEAADQTTPSIHHTATRNPAHARSTTKTILRI
jgi:hypothetical protein